MLFCYIYYLCDSLKSNPYGSHRSIDLIHERSMSVTDGSQHVSLLDGSCSAPAFDQFLCNNSMQIRNCSKMMVWI